MSRVKREKSRYFPSIPLKVMSERPEYIQEEAKAVTADIINQIKDWFGRADDNDIQDLCALFAGGKPHKRTTRIQKMFVDSINEMKNN